MRLVFVQYGDYREALRRFAEGKGPTYYSQRYTVEFVEELAGSLEHVGVVCLNANYPAERLENRVYVEALPLWEGATPEDVARAVEAQRPTHLVIRTPLPRVLSLASKRGWPALPVLADSFEGRGLKDRYRNLRLRRLLNHRHFPWIANHGINASRSLARIGVRPAKVLPYDVKAPAHPDDLPAKTAPPATGKPVRLFFAGAVTESKGVGDLLDAVAQLRARGRDARVTIAGNDREGRMARYAQEHGVAEAATFLGMVEHPEVLRQMRAHDVVVVPSRHDYSEGIPYTIYDAYCSRTPLVTSDHPMFLSNVADGVSGLIFRATDPAALAGCVERLLDEPGLYAGLSAETAAAWQRLQMPVEWSDLIRRFLEGHGKHEDWAAEHCLASPRYASRTAAPVAV